MIQDTFKDFHFHKRTFENLNLASFMDLTL